MKLAHSQLFWSFSESSMNEEHDTSVLNVNELVSLTHQEREMDALPVSLCCAYRTSFSKTHEKKTYHSSSPKNSLDAWSTFHWRNLAFILFATAEIHAAYIVELMEPEKSKVDH